MSSAPPINAALAALQAGDPRAAVAHYREALRCYPQWQPHLQDTLDFLHRRHAGQLFDESYEVEPKPVPERPVEFPSELVLPPLRGVANDYSFVEEACERRWAGGSRDYTLPVSIVIPVYNRSREVDYVLAGLLHQTYPRELMEIVIADDGSQEDVSPVYGKYQDRLRIRYCRQADLGYRLAEARNLGIATASHDTLIILDSDAIPMPGLVEDYMRRFHVERNLAMFGLRHYVSVADIDPDAYAADASLIEQAPHIVSENSVAAHTVAAGHSTDWREEHIRATGLLKTESLPYRFLVGANCGFTREVFDKVGGYSEAFRAWGFEDQEFGYRLWREGTYFIPLMEAYVWHQEPLAGKNDTDRKLGQAVTREIFVQKCPFIYRWKSPARAPFEVPLVSLYVPLHNRERYIVECIQSALAQTVEDLEVVICDDGSTDRSVEQVQRHFGHDPRVRLIRRTNGGIGAASNTAVRAARGCYIGQLDADDVLKRDAVEQAMKVLDANPRLSLVYATTEYIDNDSRAFAEGWNWPVFSREYLLTRMICHHFRLFRKRDWARTSGFNETIRNAVDYDMMLKLAEVGEVAHLNRVLYQYRKHDATTTVQHNDEQSLNNFSVIGDSLRRLGVAGWQAGPAPGTELAARSVRFRRSDKTGHLYGEPQFAAGIGANGRDEHHRT